MDPVEEQAYVLGVQALLWGYPLVCYAETTAAAVRAGPAASTTFGCSLSRRRRPTGT